MLSGDTQQEEQGVGENMNMVGTGEENEEIEERAKDWGKGVKRPVSMMSVALEGQVQNMLLLMSGDVEKNPGPNSGR